MVKAITNIDLKKIRDVKIDLHNCFYLKEYKMIAQAAE